MFKKFVTKIALVAAASLGAGQANAETVTAATKTCSFKVAGMTCAACSVTLKAAVNKLDGVKAITVSVNDKSASVTFDPSKVSTKDIEAKIDDVGYKAELNQCKA